MIRIAICFLLFASSSSVHAQFFELIQTKEKNFTQYVADARLSSGQLVLEFKQGNKLTCSAVAGTDAKLFRQYEWYSNKERHLVFWPVDNNGPVSVQMADMEKEVWWHVHGELNPKRSDPAKPSSIKQFGTVSDVVELPSEFKIRMTATSLAGFPVGKKVAYYRNEQFQGWIDVTANDGKSCVGYIHDTTQPKPQIGDEVRQWVAWRGPSGANVEGVYDSAVFPDRQASQARLVVRTVEGTEELPAQHLDSASLEALMARNTEFRASVGKHVWEQQLLNDPARTFVAMDTRSLEVTFADDRGQSTFAFSELDASTRKRILMSRPDVRRQLDRDTDQASSEYNARFASYQEKRSRLTSAMKQAQGNLQMTVDPAVIQTQLVAIDHELAELFLQLPVAQRDLALAKTEFDERRFQIDRSVDRKLPGLHPVIASRLVQNAETEKAAAFRLIVVPYQQQLDGMFAHGRELRNAQQQLALQLNQIQQGMAQNSQAASGYAEQLKTLDQQWKSQNADHRLKELQGFLAVN